MLLPATCVVCASPGGPLCGPCATALAPAPPGPVPPGLGSCRSLVRYEGTGAALVLALKHHRGPALARPLAGPLAALAGATAPVPVLVTWAPTTAAHRHHRGYDQAELLARAVARRLGLPCRGLLRRTGPAQTGRERARRLTGPRFTARGAARRWCPTASVLLVDDVVTTGATLAAGAEALRTAGALAVHGLTLARTPPGASAAPTDATTTLAEV